MNRHAEQDLIGQSRLQRPPHRRKEDVPQSELLGPAPVDVTAQRPGIREHGADVVAEARDEPEDRFHRNIGEQPACRRVAR